MVWREGLGFTIGQAILLLWGKKGEGFELREMGVQKKALLRTFRAGEGGHGAGASSQQALPGNRRKKKQRYIKRGGAAGGGEFQPLQNTKNKLSELNLGSERRKREKSHFLHI